MKADWRIKRRRGRLVAIQGDLVVLGVTALGEHDQEAALEILDPTSVQRRFCDATGLKPAVVDVDTSRLDLTDE